MQVLIGIDTFLICLGAAFVGGLVTAAVVGRIAAWREDKHEP